MQRPSSAQKFNNIAIFGANGTIGSTFITTLSTYPDTTIHAFSSTPPQDLPTNVVPHTIEYLKEESLTQAKEHITTPLDLLIIATGILHTTTRGTQIMPEKSYKELSVEKLQTLYTTNAIIPALIIKHFASLLAKDSPSVIAALSARIGSISDNRLGGWYSYRASKAALNMLIKTTSIELKRTNKNASIIGLHPGTVDSNLSKPFQKNLPKGQLFTPEYAIKEMLKVITNTTAQHTGKCFAFDGEEIEP